MDMNQKWSDLLVQAVTEPGIISKAYSLFHNYSMGNMLAALVQCNQRGITPGPIQTFNGWEKLNRHVMKGQKAIWLCVPRTSKKKNDGGEDEEVITSFIWCPRFFVLSQTQGESVPMPTIPTWDKERALAALNITEIPFDMMNGNVMGYATKRQVAVSPLAPFPFKTLAHELAHVELGHTSEMDYSDAETTPRNLRETEAECVALLLCESLELPGADFCRGYIQSWLKGDVIPERSCQRILGATDRILRAGREQ
jgi:N-terminal domain of anti-restriction factor ArdC